MKAGEKLWLLDKARENTAAVQDILLPVVGHQDDQLRFFVGELDHFLDRLEKRITDEDKREGGIQHLIRGRR